MARNSHQWSFDSSVKEARRALQENRSLESQRKLFEDEINDEGIRPQNLGPSFQSTLAVSYWCQALIAIKEDPATAWKKIHIVWRSYALTWRVHLERLAQLAYEFPEKLRKGRLPISSVGYNSFGSILMTLAFSATLGEDEAAYWFGDRCVQMAVNREPITSSDMLTTGSVEPFLFRLYCLWRGLDVDMGALGVRGYGFFQPLFDLWQDPAGLEAATCELCRLHAFKGINYDLPDDDFVFGLQEGPFRDFPVEVFFLQRVRRDLSLPIPNPKHPLLRSPLTEIPFPCPRSGFDPDLDRIYRKCKESIPNLNIPWEENVGV